MWARPTESGAGKFENMFIHFDTTGMWQTDGQTDILPRHSRRWCRASRGIKLYSIQGSKTMPPPGSSIFGLVSLSPWPSQIGSGSLRTAQNCMDPWRTGLYRPCSVSKVWICRLTCKMHKLYCCTKGNNQIKGIDEKRIGAYVYFRR